MISHYTIFERGINPNLMSGQNGGYSIEKLAFTTAITFFFKGRVYSAGLFSLTKLLSVMQDWGQE